MSADPFMLKPLHPILPFLFGAQWEYDDRSAPQPLLQPVKTAEKNLLLKCSPAEHPGGHQECATVGWSVPQLNTLGVTPGRGGSGRLSKILRGCTPSYIANVYKGTGNVLRMWGAHTCKLLRQLQLLLLDIICVKQGTKESVSQGIPNHLVSSQNVTLKESVSGRMSP